MGNKLTGRRYMNVTGARVEGYLQSAVSRLYHCIAPAW